jgi:hypothetical protein
MNARQLRASPKATALASRTLPAADVAKDSSTRYEVSATEPGDSVRFDPAQPDQLPPTWR